MAFSGEPPSLLRLDEEEDAEEDEDDEDMESDEEESKGEDEADDEEIDSDNEILGGGMDDMDIFKRKKNETNRQTAKKIEKTEEANGKAVLSQIEIYEQFVKIRIQLQILQTL